MKNYLLSTKLTVLSLNIHAGINYWGRYDPEGITQLIRDVNPDLCGLQEVDRNWSKRSRFQDLTAFFSRELGMEAEFAAALTSRRGAYGNLILSKYPIINRWSQVLLDRSEQRSFASVQLVISGIRIMFLTTHLGLSQWDRWQQVSQIKEFLSQWTGPQIICGDFNDGPDSEVFQTLAAGFQDLQAVGCLQGQGTFRFGNGQATSRIDYILATPEFLPEDFQVINSAVSDHLPLVAKLRLNSIAAHRIRQPVFYQAVSLPPGRGPARLGAPATPAPFLTRVETNHQPFASVGWRF